MRVITRWRDVLWCHPAFANRRARVHNGQDLFSVSRAATSAMGNQCSQLPDRQHETLFPQATQGEALVRAQALEFVGRDARRGLDKANAPLWKEALEDEPGPSAVVVRRHDMHAAHVPGFEELAGQQGVLDGVPDRFFQIPVISVD